MTKSKCQNGFQNDQLFICKYAGCQVHSCFSFHQLTLMVSQKVVTPVKTGVQKLCN